MEAIERMYANATPEVRAKVDALMEELKRVSTEEEAYEIGKKVTRLLSADLRDRMMHGNN